MVQSKLVKVIVTGHQGGKETLMFDCDETDTVRDLKELVAAELGISSSRILMSHRSVNLRDNASVLTYCGQNDIPIHATIAKFVGVGGIQQPQRGYTVKNSGGSSKKKKWSSPKGSSKTKKGASTKQAASKTRKSSAKASSSKTKKSSSTKGSSKSKRSKKSSLTKSKKSKKSSSYKGSSSGKRKKSKSSSTKVSSKK